MDKSSSFHKLNGDRPLTRLENKLYFLFNNINNSFPNVFVDPKISIRDFRVKDLAGIWSTSQPQSSPTRKLSDFFWHELPWSEISKLLNEIKILDIGCGSGSYAEAFIKSSNNKVHSYLGIDVYKNPKTEEISRRYKNVKFQTFDGKNISSFLKDINMITSQSAFEHIEEDLNFFRQIAQHVKEIDHPIIQVHLIPSRAGLKLYRQHGIRQYTPRNISKITKLFGKESNFILYNLGGQNSVNTHYNYITKPLVIDKGTDRRIDNEISYNKDVFNAIKMDEERIRNPAFYALIIISNTSKEIFDYNSNKSNKLI